MSAQPRLYLPPSVRPSGDWAPQQVPKIRKQPNKSWLKYIEAFGRRVGQSAGSYMDDLSCQYAAIWLCWECRHKFDHKGAHYFYEKNMRVTGRCDGCRELRPNSHLFIHESTIHSPSERVRHEHSWTPRKGG
jgi:hypothetical protein